MVVKMKRIMTAVLALTVALAGRCAAAAPENVEIGEWRYTADAVEPDWAGEAYDDLDWSAGAGPFGEKDGKLEAVSSKYTPEVLLKEETPVYYFRTYLDFDELPQADFLKASVVYDDSVKVYVNGSLVFCGNVPYEGYDEGYGSKDVLGSPDKETFLINTDLFREGKNVLAAELHQNNSSSSDLYFHMDELTASDVKLDDIRNSTLCLGLGESSAVRLVTWQGSGKTGAVRVARDKNGLYSDGATVIEAEKAFDGDYGLSTFRARISGLSPGETYYYQVTDSGASDVFTFTTAMDGGFSFVVGGDPQITDYSEHEPIEIYDSLIERASAAAAPPAFLLTLGDQSNEANDARLYMRYMSGSFSNRLPVAAIVGNHEKKSTVFSRFFVMPNMDGRTVYTSGDMSGDYWFAQGNTLFLCLNSNSHDYDAHAEFMASAKKSYIELFGRPAWIVAAMHHSIFSVGEHSQEESILEKREAFAPAFKEIGVDAVFMGHDHTYTRTYPIDGTVYFTLGSSTGTKYYDISEENSDYAEVSSQDKRPCMTRVDVTASTFTVTTYEADHDEVKVLDVCTLTKAFDLTMRINEPIMTVNGEAKEIDPGRGTAPVIREGRTLIPIRAAVEAMGGVVYWDQNSRTVTLRYGGDEIRLTVDSTTAYLNGEPKILDVAPRIMNGRTVLPIRFIAEGFGFDVEWDQHENKVAITK